MSTKECPMVSSTGVRCQRAPRGAQTATPAQPRIGTRARKSMQGLDDSPGRLNVACAEAAALARQTSTVKPESAASDTATSDDGNRHSEDRPSRESTLDAEIPDAPGGVAASKASSADASGPGAPAARTAAWSARSSARSL